MSQDHLPHYRLTAPMRSVLARMARAGQPELHTLSPARARLAYEAGAGVLEVPKATLARVEDFSITARDGAAQDGSTVELHTRLHGLTPQRAASCLVNTLAGDRPLATG